MYQVRQAPRREPAVPVDDAVENVEDVPEPVDQEMELEERTRVDEVQRAGNEEDVSNRELLEAIQRMERMLTSQVKGKKESEIVLPAADAKEKLLLVQGSRSIDELCLKAGLTAFESQSKLLCDVCTHDSFEYDDERQNDGVFTYDMFKHGDNFEEKSKPREFRMLVTKVVKHLQSKIHEKMSEDLVEKEKEDGVKETFNHKIGLRLARQIYENVKNKCSFNKYESDCLLAALSGEEIGNRNHSWMFAEEVVKEISLSIQLKLKTYFRTPLACTDECPPVGLATDKMTQKRHTNHLAAFLTPDINALLSDSFLKPVFVGMPVVNKHGGRDIAEQMIKIAESYLSNLEDQLQALNNDGQYFGLNVERHFYDLRKDLTKRKNFLIFNWDPSHRNALADKDARSVEEGQQSYFSEVSQTVQWTFKHIGYGKHYEEYLSICAELDIDPRAPITFSDTRFPQFSYNTLRNFLKVMTSLK